MYFTVQDKHRIGLITTAVTRKRTRSQLRDIAAKRPSAYPSTRALLQLQTVQQRGGKIQQRSSCDVMNLSDCTGCSSRQSFPFYLSSLFADCVFWWKAFLSSYSLELTTSKQQSYAGSFILMTLGKRVWLTAVKKTGYVRTVMVQCDTAQQPIVSQGLPIIQPSQSHVVTHTPLGRTPLDE